MITYLPAKTQDSSEADAVLGAGWSRSCSARVLELLELELEEGEKEGLQDRCGSVSRGPGPEESGQAYTLGVDIGKYSCDFCSPQQRFPECGRKTAASGSQSPGRLVRNVWFGSRLTLDQLRVQQPVF